MTAKKERETKFVIGEDIEWLQGSDSWLTLRLKDGTKFSVGGDLLFKILCPLNYNLIKHGKHWRATGVAVDSKADEE